MNIFFVGTVVFSKNMLQILIKENFKIVGVATKSESKFNADYADLTSDCEENEIPYRYVKNINDSENIGWIRSLKPDVVFCFGWSSLLKKEILELAPLGVVGYHPAALPQNRGRHPIIWSIVLGLRETASTFFFMKEGADDGDIISQESVLIGPEDDAGSLYAKLTKTASHQLPVLAKALADGTFSRRIQDDSQANYWRKRGKSDGKIDFRMTSIAIHNLVRALTYPYVGAHVEFGDQEIKIWEVKLGRNDQSNIEPGKVLQIKDEMIEVKTGDTSIWLVNHEFNILPNSNDYI